ncbi:hypothetical protein BP6252_09691 [Coleophoma cylindrospora]|uniref:Uncharacterized protein n=1 Tax=Coleophoma cylindrospora TaxID=1849047 RepID=A0A3D8QW52_9HELO|nr:hypothetical protein BP6252_09691 [Coleophoma cylindrospora]
MSSFAGEDAVVIKSAASSRSSSVSRSAKGKSRSRTRSLSRQRKRPKVHEPSTTPTSSESGSLRLSDEMQDGEQVRQEQRDYENTTLSNADEHYRVTTPPQFQSTGYYEGQSWDQHQQQSFTYSPLPPTPPRLPTPQTRKLPQLSLPPLPPLNLTNYQSFQRQPRVLHCPHLHNHHIHHQLQFKQQNYQYPFQPLQ